MSKENDKMSPEEEALRAMDNEPKITKEHADDPWLNG